jgi:hypothetical protein
MQKPRRQPTQAQIEAAHRVRILSLGGHVENATPAERRAATKRTQAAHKRRKELDQEE